MLAVFGPRLRSGEAPVVAGGPLLTALRYDGCVVDVPFRFCYCFFIVFVKLLPAAAGIDDARKVFDFFA